MAETSNKGGKSTTTAAGGTGDAPVSNVAPLRKTVPCPECRRPSHREHYPFCSDRCRNVDLNRWLTGSYAIPVTEDEEDPDAFQTRRPEDE